MLTVFKYLWKIILTLEKYHSKLRKHMDLQTQYTIIYAYKNKVD